MAARKKALSAEQIEQIKTMAGLGLRSDQMAAILNLSERTFFRRINDTPGASGSIEKGRALAASNVTKTAYQLASGGKCPAMTMFWLKCREQWKEISHVEHSGSVMLEELIGGSRVVKDASGSDAGDENDDEGDSG